MAPSSNSKANPNGYKSKGKQPTNFMKNFPLSREEQAAVDGFQAFFAESPKSKERKADEKSYYQPAEPDTPKAKMENPLPPGAKGLAASRWAKKEEEDPKPLLPKATKGLANSRLAKKPSNKGNGKATYTKKFGPTPEEDAAVKAFFFC